MNRKNCNIKNKGFKTSEHRCYKLTEKLLKESELALKQLVENMNSAVAVYEAKNNGKDFIFKNFNRAAERIEHIKREQIIGKSVLKVFPGVKDFGLFKIFQKVWKTGKPEHFPIAFYKDKRISGWKENYVYRLPNKDIVAIYDDITPHKTAEERLQQSEEKFSKAFQISPYAIAITRAEDGSVIDVNDAFISNLGFSKKEILGSSTIGLKIWVNEENRHEMVSDLRSGRPVISREYQFRTKSGKILTGLFSAQIIQLSQGQCILSNMVDITGRKKKEQEIREIKNMDEAILDSIGDAVFASDKNGNIILFNKIAEEMTGISAKKAIGSNYKKIVNFISEKDGKPTNDFISEAIKNNKITKMTNHVLLVRKDGGKMPVADSAAPVKDNDGNIIGCVVVFRDVMKEREMDKAKTEFASLTSHQLRTPTTAINWYSEMLLNEEVGQLNEKQKEYIKEIHEGNHRMTDLMDALLNVSQIELGTFTIQPVTTDIAILADDVLLELKTQISKKSLEIEKKYEKGETVVKNDKKLIRIIVQNLLSNAVSFTPPNGKISIKIKRTGRYVKIDIKDNGCGIPPSAKPNMYTKFFRADNAVSMEPDGTGLGLYITKSIVDALGATIRFKSKEALGTTFYVNIPDHYPSKKSKKI